MEIFINISELEELDLSPTLYCYLYSIYFDKDYVLCGQNTKNVMNSMLEGKGYLKVNNNGIDIREKTVELFKKGTPTNESVDEWITDWRELFPKGVKSGGRPVRGDKQGVIKKMKSFMKNNPTTTKEQIMDATRQYVFDSSLKSYSFIICADYFINKNGSSMLGAMIEDVEERGSTLKSMEDGQSSWYKEI